MNLHHVKTTIFSFAHAAINQLLMLIAPPYCMACKRFLSKRDVFCSECVRLIKPIVSHDLKVTDSLTVKVFAVGTYTDPLRFLILAKSWSNSVASRQLGQLVWEMTYIKNVPFDVIVPIPLHWMRYSWRGYNQSEEMAKELSHRSGKPVYNFLKRVRYAPFQSAVSPEKRVENVKGVFELKDSKEARLYYKGKHILLVDDLLTTGATIRAAAKELNKLKPASITIIVAARVT